MPDRQSWDDNLRDTVIVFLQFLKSMRFYLGICLVVITLVWALGQAGVDFGAIVEGAKGLLSTGGGG